MDIIKKILEQDFDIIQKNVFATFRFTLMTGGVFNKQSDIHDLIIIELKQYLDNTKLSLTDKEKNVA